MSLASTRCMHAGASLALGVGSVLISCQGPCPSSGGAAASSRAAGHSLHANSADAGLHCLAIATPFQYLLWSHISNFGLQLRDQAGLWYYAPLHVAMALTHVCVLLSRQQPSRSTPCPTGPRLGGISGQACWDLRMQLCTVCCELPCLSLQRLPQVSSCS